MAKWRKADQFVGDARKTLFPDIELSQQTTYCRNGVTASRGPRSTSAALAPPLYLPKEIKLNAAARSEGDQPSAPACQATPNLPMEAPARRSPFPARGGPKPRLQCRSVSVYDRCKALYEGLYCGKG